MRKRRVNQDGVHISELLSNLTVSNKDAQQRNRPEARKPANETQKKLSGKKQRNDVVQKSSDWCCTSIKFLLLLFVFTLVGTAVYCYEKDCSKLTGEIVGSGATLLKAIDKQRFEMEAMKTSFETLKHRIMNEPFSEETEKLMEYYSHVLHKSDYFNKIHSSRLNPPEQTLAIAGNQPSALEELVDIGSKIWSVVSIGLLIL
ncbi:unnamed protein product [Moneuplotes crassus]|uniref:Uncharacterized protein n=1 Tax=Euplotes crassus TaxID=5936 RepID=A0AAD1XR64_EUPCR|nr:unnamed protein product [Moneuplotes crassus]